MERRTLFKALLTSAVALFATERAVAGDARAQRVVYHLADADKVAFALANMKNHHTGRPEGLSLSAVVHGSALSLFRAAGDNEALKQQFASALKAGDIFYACANTLAAHGWTLADLLPGFALADKGGVVKLADLQAEGWIYLRP